MGGGVGGSQLVEAALALPVSQLQGRLLGGPPTPCAPSEMGLVIPAPQMLSEVLRGKYFQTSLLSLTTLRAHFFPWGHCQVQSGGLYKMSAAGVGTAHSNSLRQLYLCSMAWGSGWWAGGVWDGARLLLRVTGLGRTAAMVTLPLSPGDASLFLGTTRSWHRATGLTES